MKGINLIKKGIITVLFLFSIVLNSVLADGLTNLKSRLSKINSFYANFTQKVIDSNGNIIQKGQGRLWMKRPNQFNWHMIQPNESLLISDGKTLWFYNPFVKQVTITWLKDITKNTPFTLIMYNQISDWRKYKIDQAGDNFVLTPKRSVSNLKHFIINVTQTGVINQFTIVEQDNQTSSYQFKSHYNDIVDSLKFTFTPPHDVMVDDQRK